MLESKKLGNLGEQIARTYLERKDFVFIAANFSVYESEIDLIMKDPKRDEIVFVEVKTRTFSGNLSNAVFYAEDAIDYRKVRKMQIGAEVFLLRNSMRNTYFRFDAVLVYMKDTKAFVQHIENITN